MASPKSEAKSLIIGYLLFTLLEVVHSIKREITVSDLTCRIQVTKYLSRQMLTSRDSQVTDRVNLWHDFG